MHKREMVETTFFRAFYALVAVFMMFPLVVVISTSLTKSGFMSFPPEQLSLKWYRAFLQSDVWIQALKNSLITATGTTVLSTFIGASTAFGLKGAKSDWMRKLVPLALVPLLLPPVVIGMTLLIYLSQLGLNRTYLSIIIAHSLWATPLVFFIMQAALSRFDWDLREAGLDLGATPGRAFLEVVLPQIRSGLFAAATIAFIISLQEFIMTLFLSGQHTRTIPVYAWINLRNIIDPIVSVVSTILIGTVLLLLGVASLLTGLEWLSRQI